LDVGGRYAFFGVDPAAEPAPPLVLRRCGEGVTQVLSVCHWAPAEASAGTGGGGPPSLSDLAVSKVSILASLPWPAPVPASPCRVGPEPARPHVHSLPGNGGVDASRL
jgi:hypothetical protein